jgi:hypothetical protein
MIYFSVDYDDPPTISDPWNIPIPQDLNYILSMEDGVMHVYKSKEDQEDGRRKSSFFPFN